MNGNKTDKGKIMDTEHLNAIAAQVAAINTAIQAIFEAAPNKKRMLACYDKYSEFTMSHLLNAQTPDSYVKDVQECLSAMRTFLEK